MRAAVLHLVDVAGARQLLPADRVASIVRVVSRLGSSQAILVDALEEVQDAAPDSGREGLRARARRLCALVEARP